MGLPIPSMRLIIREHKKEPFHGRVLTLGRMAILATYEQVLALFRSEGVNPKQLDNTIGKQTNIPSVQKIFTSDAVFFKLLGVEQSETLDISDYEKAEHIHDMNIPVPQNLIRQFDAVFDFGTTEHIFNTKQALDNISLMLKPSGRVLHLVAATNRIGHGYHMFSPCLFYDYYWANNFVDCQGYLVESGRGDPSFIKWKLFKYEYNADRSIATAFKSRNAVGNFFVARKTESSTFGVVPNQYQFMGRFAQSAKTSQSISSLDSVKKRTPLFIKKLFFVKKAYSYLRILRGTKKSGLQYLGKI